MELVYAFFADAAEVLPNGRFFVFNGGFDGVGCFSLPARINTLAILSRIRIPHEEQQVPHTIEVSCFAPSGELALPVMLTQFDVSKVIVPNRRDNYYMFLGSIIGMEIKEYGNYDFRIKVDGNLLGSVGLIADPAPVDVSGVAAGLPGIPS